MRFHRASLWFLLVGLLAVMAVVGCTMSPFEPHLGRATLQSSGRSNDPQVAAQRPLSDFISAQGTTSLFFPPLPDYIGWLNNNPQTRFTLIDYTGLAAAYLATHGGPSLGTQASGTVSERALADGRAQVTVVVHTVAALTWTCGLPGDISTNPVLFGVRGGDLLADPSLQPALSSVTMKVVFTNDAPGAPLPDLVNAFILGNATPAQSLLFLSFVSDGNGPLHAAFGVPDGTRGKQNVTQTGLFVTQFKGATADGFPAERVDLHTAGRGTAAP